MKNYTLQSRMTKGNVLPTGSFRILTFTIKVFKNNYILPTYKICGNFIRSYIHTVDSTYMHMYKHNYIDTYMYIHTYLLTTVNVSKSLSQDKFELEDFKYRNTLESDEVEVENLVDLPILNEPEVLLCLKKRFFKEHVYTYTGKILIAINPLREIAKQRHNEKILFKFAHDVRTVCINLYVCMHTLVSVCSCIYVLTLRLCMCD